MAKVPWILLPQIHKMGEEELMCVQTNITCIFVLFVLQSSVLSLLDKKSEFYTLL